MDEKKQTKIKISKKLKAFLWTIGLYLISSAILWNVGIFIIETWFPKPSPSIKLNVGIVYFNGFPIPMGIILLLSIGLTIGWVIHGIGFKLIEVGR